MISLVLPPRSSYKTNYVVVYADLLFVYWFASGLSVSHSDYILYIAVAYLIYNNI